jgi:transcriptional regulator with XRE-family HTH domain
MDLLSSLVRTQRGSRGLRDVAAEMGNVSPSTLSRVENGNKPDMDTFLLLCDWLDVPPAKFFYSTMNRDQIDQLPASDSIAFLLRADRNLDPATANVLATLVKAAYRDLPQRQEADRDAEQREQ